MEEKDDLKVIKRIEKTAEREMEVGTVLFRHLCRACLPILH